MAINLNGSIQGGQNSFVSPPGGANFPFAQATGDFTGPFGVGQALVRGTGTVQIGPLGVATSVPLAPGFTITPANTVNGLGLASPFATTSSFLNNIGMNSFGAQNPYSPLIGTPFDLNFNKILATGAFGGYQNPLSPFTGMAGLPLPDGSFGFGGPGGSQAGNLLNTLNPQAAAFAGLGGGVSGNLGGGIPGGLVGVPGGLPGGAPGLAPGMGGLPFGAPSLGAGLPGGGIPGFGGGMPGIGGGGFPGGGGMPGFGGGLPGIGAMARPGGGGFFPVGGGGGNPNPFPDLLNNPTLFAPVPDSVIPGVAQVFTQQGGDFANRFAQITDGIGKLFLQGQADPRMPRGLWGSGGVARTPFGIFETGVGPLGGNANAGILGAQASGQAWASVRAANNPAMIISYANPYYNNYNFNEGFTNA